MKSFSPEDLSGHHILKNFEKVFFRKNKKCQKKFFPKFSSSFFFSFYFKQRTPSKLLNLKEVSQNDNMSCPTFFYLPQDF